MENATDLDGTWAFPIRFDQSGAPVMVSAAESVEQAIRLILQTAWSERLQRPTFGGGLQRFLFAPNSPVTWRAMTRAVQEALELWEPRIELLHVEVTRGKESDGVLISVEYRMRATGELALFRDNFLLGAV